MITVSNLLTLFPPRLCFLLSTLSPSLLPFAELPYRVCFPFFYFIPSPSVAFHLIPVLNRFVYLLVQHLEIILLPFQVDYPEGTSCLLRLLRRLLLGLPASLLGHLLS